MRSLGSISPVVLWTALSLLGSASLQDQQQPLFRTGTVLVPLDVRVVDRSGKPIENLKPSDFAIYEDGVRQTIAHFSVRSLVPAAVSASSLQVRDSPWLEADAPTHRVFAIVLGRGRLQHPAMGVDALMDFVEKRLLPQDWVTLVAYQRATNFTRDRESIVRLLDRYRARHGEIEAHLRHWFADLQGVYGSDLIPRHIEARIDGLFAGTDLPRIRQLAYGATADGELNRLTQELLERVDPSTSESAQTYHTVARHDLENLYATIEYLRPLEGEKHLIFVTEAAFDRFGDRMTDILADMAADARVTLSTIQTGGVPTSWTRAAYNRPPRIQSRSFLQAFGIEDAKHAAAITGGFASMYRRAHDALRDIDETTRAQYLLGYHPSTPVLDGRRREIRVQVNVPGASVRHRQVYFANPRVGPADPTELIRRLRMSTAAAYRGLLTDLPLTITAAQYDRVSHQLSVDLLVDVAALQLAADDDRRTGSIELLVFAGDEREKPIGELEQRLDFALVAADYDKTVTDGYRHRASLKVARQPRHIKAIVYETQSDRLGSAVLDMRRRATR